MNKIYGQEFLNQIRNEDQEDRNQRAREEAKQRRKQIELEKQIMKQQQQAQKLIHESIVLNDVKNSFGTKTSNFNFNNKKSRPVEKIPTFMVINESFDSYRKCLILFYLFIFIVFDVIFNIPLHLFANVTNAILAS